MANDNAEKIRRGVEALARLREPYSGGSRDDDPPTDMADVGIAFEAAREEIERLTALVALTEQARAAIDGKAVEFKAHRDRLLAMLRGEDEEANARAAVVVRRLKGLTAQLALVSNAARTTAMLDAQDVLRAALGEEP